MEFRMKCPECGKRAFDISGLPKEQIEIELKCPNCHHFVRVACIAEMLMRRPLKDMNQNMSVDRK